MKIEYLRKGSVKIDSPSERPVCNNYTLIRYSAALLRFYDYRKNPKAIDAMSISEHSAPIVLGESTISEVRRDIIGYYTMMNYKIFQKNISL